MKIRQIPTLTIFAESVIVVRIWSIIRKLHSFVRGKGSVAHDIM